MMRKNGVCPESLAQCECNPLRKTASIDENQRCAMRQYEFCNVIVDLVPHLGARDDPEFVARGPLPRVPSHADGRRPRFRVRTKQAGSTSIGFTVAERPIRCGRLPVELHPTRQRSKKDEATLVIRHGMDFIHDHEVDRGPKHLARLLGGEENERAILAW